MKRKSSRLPFIPILFCVFFCVSCAKEEQKASVIPPAATLRNNIERIYSTITWADAPGAPPFASVPSSSVNLPVPAALPFIARAPAVYPSLAGFGSLDVSALPKGAGTFLNDFFSEVRRVTREPRFSFSQTASGEQTSPEAAAAPAPSPLVPYFVPRMAYGARIFEYDMSQYPPLRFWRFGTPFTSGGYTGLPVRLYCGETVADIRIYVTRETETGGWLIDQIQFGRVVQQKETK